jgi:NtrC-family two-component system sensor histidine kinase KinB
MTRASISILIIWLLAVVMVAALILNLPNGAAINEFGMRALIYGGLTAFALYFGVLLTEGEFSPAHIVGMVAFLALPRAAQPLMTWAVFLGGVVGGTALVLRKQDVTLRRRLTERTARSVVAISARVTFSFIVAAQVYTLLGGGVPLTAPLRDEIPALLIFSLTYSLIYFLIFILETYSDGRSIERMLRENWVLLAVQLVLPIPFGILGAQVLVITPTALVVIAAGVSVLTLGMHGLSRAQFRMRKQVNELRSLAAVGQALQSDLKLSSLLSTVYQQVNRLLPIDQFIVALFDPETGRLQYPLAARRGVAIPDYIEQSDKTLLGHVLRTQSPLLISDNVTEAARKIGLETPGDTVESWLGVPLLAGGKLLGAMAVASEDPQQHFGPDDLRLLSTVTASASVAIDNAQLYEWQTARANQLNTLNQVLSLLTGTLSPEEVMDAILSSASLVSQATAVAIYLFWDEAGQNLSLARAAGLSDPFIAEPPEPLLTKPNGDPVFVADVRKDERAIPYRAVMGGEHKMAWAELPLAVGEQGLGTLVLYFDQPQTFHNEQVEILRAFTNQAAQAIKNARLYTTADQALERRAEQMYTLAALGRQLTATMNQRSICNLVLARALQLTRAAAGFIVLKDGETLTLAAESGYPPMSLSPARIEASPTGTVLSNGQPVRYNDLRVEQTPPPIMQTSRSQLTVPILRGGSTLGAITLESEYVRAFSEEDTHFVTQLANQTIIALDNTRLFERIAEARDRLQVILNAMTEAIVLVDKSGEIALANPRVDLIGLNPKDLLNQDIDTLLERPELDLAERMGFQSDQKVRKLLKELRTPGAWVGMEAASYTVEGEHGILYIQREVIPVLGENGEPMGMLLVFYDETEERELSQMREDLSSMIVHDLRSPLTAVTTGLKLLRDLVPQDSTFRPLVESTTETSQRAIRKLMSRVDSLLDISKMESGQLNLETEPTELATLADNVCAELSPLAQELEVTLTSQIDGDTPPLDIDGDKVERVLQNLVDNALKFCPANGSVTILTYPPGTHGAAQGFTRVDVQDTGPGVPEEYKTRLFERFVQVKGRRGARRGIGLGLTFCRLVAEAHGGRIWIEDNPAGGSIFAFTLPVAKLDKYETDELPVIGNWG